MNEKVQNKVVAELRAASCVTVGSQTRIIILYAFVTLGKQFQSESDQIYQNTPPTPSNIRLL